MGSSPQHNRGPFFNADLKKNFSNFGGVWITNGALGEWLF